MTFPSSPTIGDSHSISDNSWTWNGFAWDKINIGTPSSYVISINGMSGAIGITAGDNIDIIKSGATYSIRLSPNVIIDGGLN